METTEKSMSEPWSAEETNYCFHCFGQFQEKMEGSTGESKWYLKIADELVNAGLVRTKAQMIKNKQTNTKKMEPQWWNQNESTIVVQPELFWMKRVTKVVILCHPLSNGIALN